METTSKRYVDVTNAAKTKLAKLFKCTETFVYMVENIKSLDPLL